MTTPGDPGLRLPIKLDSTSNGEFTPVPLDAGGAPCPHAGAGGTLSKAHGVSASRAGAT